MTARMKAVIFHGPRRIRLEEMPRPAPGPGQVLLKVGAALTCGTDFKAYRQGHKVLLGEPPSPFGHEVAGTVVDVGDGVENLRAGDRVVAANSAPCLDRCYFCARGQNQLCENLKLHNGAYAEYNLVPAHIARHNLWRIPEAVPFSNAALAEPLACAVHGVDAIGCAEGETIAVLGAGPMALLLIQALRARNCRVIVCGRSYENLETAKKAGAHEAYSSLDEDVGAAVRRSTGGRGADGVFEAVGRAETWQQSLGMVRKGGRVCLFGGCASGTVVPIDAHRVHYDQLTLHGVFHHTPKYFKSAVDLLASGSVAVDLLVTRRIGLPDVPDFFAENADRSIPKAAVIP